MLAELKQFNNGDLSLPLTRAKQCGIGHHVTLARSLRALCAVGLVALARKGGSTKGGQRLPSLYRLTDRDCYEIPKMHLEALSATNEWRRITTVEQGQQLIQAADEAVKKDPEKLKSLGHPVTTIRTPSDVMGPNIGTPSDTWIQGLGHVVTMAKNSEKPLSTRVSDTFSPHSENTSHRTPTRPPLYVATPTGEFGGLGVLSAGCLVARLPAARTLFGRILHRARPSTKPVGYHDACTRLLLGATHG